MAAPTLDTVMATVDGLLGAALDPAALAPALDDVRRLFSGSKACLARFGGDLGKGEAITTNPDPSLQSRVFGDLKPDFQILSASVERIPLGAVYHFNTVAGQDWLANSRAYREWFAPQDMYDGIACRLVGGAQSYWFFDVQRGRTQPRFNAAERRTLALLWPVLARTMEVRQHLGGVELDRDLARNTLDMLADGMVTVDRDMTIIQVNAAAERLLTAGGSALLIRRGRLTARRACDRDSLRAIVTTALRARDEPLRPQNGSLVVAGEGKEQPDLSLCALPVLRPRGPDHVVIAFKPLSERPDMAAHLASLFALTPAEARLAGLLLAGSTLAEAASVLAVRLSTVRTHLARLFQKTGTSQQGQLVALLARAAPSFPPRRAPLAGDQ